MRSLLLARCRRLFLDAPIKAKILVLVMTVLAFPFMLNLGLIRENYRAVSSFSDDVALFAAIDRLGEANARNPSLVGAYLESGSFEDLRAYNENVDALSADLDAIEKAASDLETRFILSSIRNSFQSFYEEAHSAIRARRSSSPDPYAGYYRAERIARYLDDYVSMLTDRNLAASAAAYERRVQGAAAGRALALSAFLAGALICVAFGIVFSDYLTGPLRRLAAAASRMAAGDLAVDPMPISSSDEVGRLSASFNTMSAHIAGLVEGLKEKAAVEKRLHREELRGARSARLLKESEFLALQARINPHFLFNTLNSISRDVTLRGGRGATALIDALSSLLRYSLDQGGGVSTLADELEIVRKYAFIQGHRFAGRIRVDIECRVERPDEVALPVFSIQPIVENSFIHGLEPKVGGGRISVSAERARGSIVIRIEDDGIGMDEERLRAVRRGADRIAAGRPSYGLANVRDRLRIFTGDKRCFSIERRASGGVAVAITLREGKHGERIPAAHRGR